jgi:hypothetical protein
MKNMKKLIDLLNEYENTDNWENWNQVEFRENKIISKKFWFIKRLIDNDKIAYDRYIKEFRMKDFWKFYYMSKAEVVIANLSLQDKPVEFLISILK